MWNDYMRKHDGVSYVSMTVYDSMTSMNLIVAC